MKNDSETAKAGGGSLQRLVRLSLSDFDDAQLGVHVRRTGNAPVVIRLPDSSLGDREIAGSLVSVEGLATEVPPPVPNHHGPEDSMLPLCESLGRLCRDLSVRFDIRISCDVITPNGIVG
jgi:hypothetical protein